MACWGRPPGEIPQILDQQIPGQGQNMAHAKLPSVPARDLQEDNMIENENAVHGDHEEVELDRLQPVQEMIDREDEDMGQLEYQHPPD